MSEKTVTVDAPVVPTTPTPVEPVRAKRTRRTAAEVAAEKAKKGTDTLALTMPLDLANMVKAAASEHGDLSGKLWPMRILADAANASDLKRADGTVWTFDTAQLDALKTRVSTKALTPEQKDAKDKAAKAVKAASTDLTKRVLAKFVQKQLAGETADMAALMQEVMTEMSNRPEGAKSMLPNVILAK